VEGKYMVKKRLVAGGECLQGKNEKKHRGERKKQRYKRDRQR
jgi:hypothetical protein